MQFITAYFDLALAKPLRTLVYATSLDYQKISFTILVYGPAFR